MLYTLHPIVVPKLAYNIGMTFNEPSRTSVAVTVYLLAQVVLVAELLYILF